MFPTITVRSAQFSVPADVQALMSVATLTFKFLDPVECLMRLLTVGPLSADMANMAFTPRLNHSWYEDLCPCMCFKEWLHYIVSVSFRMYVQVRWFRRRWQIKKSLRCYAPGFVSSHRRIILRRYKSWQKRSVVLLNAWLMFWSICWCIFERIFWCIFLSISLCIFESIFL